MPPTVVAGFSLIFLVKLVVVRPVTLKWPTQSLSQLIMMASDSLVIASKILATEYKPIFHADKKCQMNCDKIAILHLSWGLTTKSAVSNNKIWRL